LYHVLNHYALELIRKGWHEPLLEDMLAGIGETMQVSRAFLHRARLADGSVEMTHEWHASGLSPVLDDHHFDLRNIPDEVATFSAGQPVIVQRPEEAGSVVRGVMERLGTRAFLMAPILCRGDLGGSIGVSEARRDRTWHAEERDFLVTLGQLLGLVWERRELEHKVRVALSEARESERLKERFLTTISHEVRNPLNAIIGLSTLLEGDAADKLTVSQRQMIRFIRNAGEKLMQTMENMLYLSRVRQVVPDPRPEWINMRELAGELTAFMQGRLVGCADSVSFQVDLSDAPERIFADRDLIWRILVNLLDNAAKFTTNGSIGCRLVRDDRWLCLEVTDTGIGIAEAERERIFQEFYQAGDVSTRHFEGAGLGLAIVRALVDAMGGRITVESETGRGTRFQVLLPEGVRDHG